MSHEYENFRRVNYDTDEDGTMSFVPVCPICGRFVKADDVITTRGGHVTKPNATCKKCGRVEMLFEGYF